MRHTGTGQPAWAGQRALLLTETWPALLAGSLALTLYVRTLAPGLTWSHDGADGGDFLAAALTHGVAHPPGYPLYVILLQIALKLFAGTGGPARIGNFTSAVLAAIAVAALADLARRSLPAARWRNPLALVAALAWATSPALWSQAVITEVYTLEALIGVGLLWLLWQWHAATGADGQQSTPTAARWRWLVLASATMGLGLGAHLSIALMLPAIAAWLWSNRQGLASAPRWGWPASACAFIAGLAVYAYVPLAASRYPAVNWGDPQSQEGFFWLVTARPYGELLFGLPLTWLPARLAAWPGEALRQFWPWGCAVAVLGFWRLDQTDRAWWRCTGLIALAFSIYAIAYNTADSYVYLILVWAVAALWLAYGLADLLRRAQAWADGTAPGLQVARAKSRMHVPALLLALLLLPCASAVVRYEEMDLSRDEAAEDFIAGSLATADPHSALLVATDRPTFALWYAVYGLRSRPDVIPLNVNLYAYRWYREEMARRHALPTTSGPVDWPIFLQQLAADRPLYRAEPLPFETSGFRETPAGPLTRLSPG